MDNIKTNTKINGRKEKMVSKKGAKNRQLFCIREREREVQYRGIVGLVRQELTNVPSPAVMAK
jgi:hypothetical protein